MRKSIPGCGSIILEFFGWVFFFLLVGIILFSVLQQLDCANDVYRVYGNFPSEWSFSAGCRIETSPGVWLPFYK